MINLTPRVLHSFVGVRGRVKAAVANQRRSVTLSEALLQVQRVQKASVTNKSTGESRGKQFSSEGGSEIARTPTGTK